MTPLEVLEMKTMLSSIMRSFGKLESRIASPAATQLCEIELKLRKARRRHLPPHLGDAAWDILLELDRAQRQSVRAFVSEVGIEAGIPLATTLRYLVKLDDERLIERLPDPDDRRRIEVRLTGLGRSTLDRIFNDAMIAMERGERTVVAPLPVMIG